MKKTFCVMLILIVSSSSTCMASSIKKITLSELQSKATYIVTGEVTHVTKTGNQDTVFILVGSYLKGENSRAYFKFVLISRGGLKDFDPALKKGDTGVFFLKETKKGETKKAYWGSVATFQQNNFHISDKKKKTEKKLSELGPLSDLQKASFRGDVKTIRQILKKLDKKGKIKLLAKLDNNWLNNAPLELAIANGQTDAVKELIASGANVNTEWGPPDVNAWGGDPLLQQKSARECCIRWACRNYETSS